MRYAKSLLERRSFLAGPLPNDGLAKIFKDPLLRAGLSLLGQRRLFALLGPAPLLRLGDAVARICAQDPLFADILASPCFAMQKVVAACRAQQLLDALQPGNFFPDQFQYLITVHSLSLFLSSFSLKICRRRLGDPTRCTYLPNRTSRIFAKLPNGYLG